MAYATYKKGFSSDVPEGDARTIALDAAAEHYRGQGFVMGEAVARVVHSEELDAAGEFLIRVDAEIAELPVPEPVA